MPRGIRVRLDGGLNLSDPPSELAIGELSLARNSHYLPESLQLSKVRGRSSFGTLGASATGITFIKFRTGGSFLIGSGGTSYYTAPVGSSGAFTARATGLTSVGRMEAAYYNGTDRAYLIDGVNRMRVLRPSDLNMRAAGLTAPSSATLTFLNNGATTYPVGSTFSFCHTEYDSTNDVESGPSTVLEMAATNANGTFKYALPTVTNASPMDKIRVYRTQQGGSVFYRIAEFASTNVRYYDGDDSEALGSSVDNDTVWGFKTVDDQFLSTQPLLPMVGAPIRANYITQNGTIPIGDILIFFQGSLCIAGVTSFPQDLYFSMQDAPETFTPANYVREENGRGDPITGLGIANDRLIAFCTNSIFRHNTLPQPTDPLFGLSVATREEVTSDHGCIAKRTVVNFGVGQPNNRLFYLSTRGPMMTDGYNTWPLNEDLDWSDRVVGLGGCTRAIAQNFPKYQQIWLFVPSPSSSVNDIAFIYHYHPNHVKRQPGVGKWTGPIHVRCVASTVSYGLGDETRLYTTGSDSSGTVYVEDTGTRDASLYDNADGDIDWEWETGDQPFGEESAHKRVHRVFLNVQGTDSFDASLKYAVNKADKEHSVPLTNITSNAGGTVRFGSSDVKKLKTRSYRGGVWQVGSHFRWHMQETAQAERSIVSLEMEAEPWGRQK